MPNGFHRSLITRRKILAIAPICSVDSSLYYHTVYGQRTQDLPAKYRSLESRQFGSARFGCKFLVPLVPNQHRCGIRIPSPPNYASQSPPKLPRLVPWAYLGYPPGGHRAYFVRRSCPKHIPACNFIRNHPKNAASATHS
jgi:hypothetical protein